MSDDPVLKPLHHDSTLSNAKLAIFERHRTDDLLASLLPGQEHSLKTKIDGTMMDGHHRVFVLRSRGIDVEVLPRDVLAERTEEF